MFRELRADFQYGCFGNALLTYGQSVLQIHESRPCLI